MRQITFALEVQALPRAKNIWLRELIAAAQLFGDVSLPLSMEALGHAVGGDDDGPATLDASRRGCGVRAG
ncbi:hypothetical protein B1689_02150 [Geobacillus sp. 44C]|nr:hypothetical protein B1689_02150 [Geobacillus sp. 44C]